MGTLPEQWIFDSIRGEREGKRERAERLHVCLLYSLLQPAHSSSNQCGISAVMECILELSKNRLLNLILFNQEILL